jgi:hypothetical protein
MKSKAALALLLLAGVTNAYAQTLSVSAFSPDRFSLSADTLNSITVTLNQAVDVAAFNDASLIVYGDLTGYRTGSISFSNNNQTIRFTPSGNFASGERVTVLLVQGLKAANGPTLTNSFQWSFFVKSQLATNAFNPGGTNSPGQGPQSIVIRDFNGDDIPDFAVTKSRDHDVGVWQNDGAATFSPLDEDNIGNTPRGMTSADLDRDGDFDLAAVNEGDGTISILTNDAGAFTNSATSQIGEEPTATQHGDVNGDGWLDLLTANDSSSTISVLFNDGSGNFLPQIEYAAGGGPLGISLDDLDNDGDLDAVVSNRTLSAVSILLNNGAGVFSLNRSVPVAAGPRAIATADFDQDGWADIAVGNQEANFVSVILSEAGAFSNIQTVSTGAEPFAIGTGDLDGDLDADIVVSNRTGGDVNLILNNGSGSFSVSTAFAVGTQPRALAIGDLDGDRALDIMVANWSDDEIKIYLNTVDTTSLPVNSPPPAPIATAPADNALLHPGAGNISLTWNVPADADGEALHFKVEISPSSSFSTIAIVAESNVSSSGFSPALPVLPTTPVAAYSFANSLADGTYWWRISAFDGTEYGANSTPRRFRLDTTPPTAQQLSTSPPGFAPNWFNPNSTDSVTITVQFSEIHARRIDFNFGGLANATTLSGITSGLNQTASISVPLAAGDGTYALTATIFDSVGLSASSATSIRLDGTPPAGATATSPAVSDETSFPVTWQSTAADGGVGLSGAYDIRVRTNDEPWQTWHENFLGQSDTYAGLSGHSYSFEVAAYDLLGNREPFTGQAETTTAVDTTSEDLSAPGPPFNFLVDGLGASTWKSTPGFSIVWQLPSDRSGIARVYHKLGTAPTSNTDFSGSSEGPSTLNVTATAENGQSLHVWLEDGAGNVDYRNHASVLLKYDKTPPAIDSLALAAPLVAPNWFNPQFTSQAQLEVYFSEQNLQSVTFDSDQISGSGATSGNKTTFTLDLSALSDGTYPLTATVQDSAGNRVSSSTNLAIDGTGPTGATATSTDTSTTTSFLVSWANSGTDAGTGLSGRYEVMVRIDSGNWQSWQSNFLGTSAVFENAVHNRAYEFEVAAYDRAGNLEIFSGVPETKTIVDTDFIDTEPPQLTGVLAEPVSEGSPFSVQVNLQDNIQILSAILHYRSGGETMWRSMAFSLTAGSLYQAVIPGEEFPPSGLVYYLSVSDGTNESFAPENWQEEPYYVPATISGSNNQGLVSPVLPGGTTANAYKMISLPLSVVNVSPADVLTDDLGAYDPESWRLFEYDTGSDSYNEYPDITGFTPGKAFWLISNQPGLTFDTGAGVSFEANKPFVITLKQGWNDIAVPFAFPVDWDMMDVPAGVMGPYTFDNGWILPPNVSTMFPWEGYSVFSPENNLSISIPATRSGLTTKTGLSDLQKLHDDIDWQLTVRAVSEKAQDLNNVVGVSKTSTDTWDRLDYLEPPSPGGFISLRFPHDDWKPYQGNFTTDFRKSRPDGHVWHFEVLTDLTDEDIRIEPGGLESLPSEFEVWLVDRERAELVDLAAANGYDYAAESGVRSFDLVIGTPDFIGQSDVVQEVMPKVFALEQNFPNPFNAGTTFRFAVPKQEFVEIEVYNLLGQKVRSLVAGEMTAGKHTVNWDATDDFGREVSSGVYLINMSAGKFGQSRKALLLR